MLPHPTAHLNSRNREGDTPLTIAVRQGQEKVVDALLAQQMVNVDISNKRGETPLMVAAEQGHRKIAVALLDKVKDVNIQSNEGDTPLMEAAEKGQKDIVEALLENGARVDVSNKKGVKLGKSVAATLLFSRRNRWTRGFKAWKQERAKLILRKIVQKLVANVCSILEY